MKVEDLTIKIEDCLKPVGLQSEYVIDNYRNYMMGKKPHIIMEMFFFGKMSDPFCPYAICT
jgi:hypothetical protein